MNSALNCSRRSAIAAAIACEHPQVVGDGPGAVLVNGGEIGGDAAPTLPITQEATISLSRRVNLVLGRRRGDLVCPGEWPYTFGSATLTTHEVSHIWWSLGGSCDSIF